MYDIRNLKIWSKVKIPFRQKKIAIDNILAHDQKHNKMTTAIAITLNSTINNNLETVTKQKFLPSRASCSLLFQMLLSGGRGFFDNQPPQAHPQMSEQGETDEFKDS